MPNYCSKRSLPLKNLLKALERTGIEVKNLILWTLFYNHTEDEGESRLVVFQVSFDILAPWKSILGIVMGIV